MSIKQRLTTISLLKEFKSAEFHKEILSMLKKYHDLFQLKLDFDTIIVNLECNRYPSMAHLRNDINSYFSQILRLIGKETLLGKAIITIQRSVTKKLFSEMEKNKKSRQSDLIKISNRINDLLKIMPNTTYEIEPKSTSNDCTNQQKIQDQNIPNDQFLQITQEDLRMIHSYLSNLKSDEEIIKATDIISIFDNKSVFRGKANFFMNQLSPFTIVLLQNYINQNS